jgi:hypothetical protein
MFVPDTEWHLHVTSLKGRRLADYVLAQVAGIGGHGSERLAVHPDGKRLVLTCNKTAVFFDSTRTAHGDEA